MLVWFWRRLSVTYGARAAVGDTPGVEEGGLGRKAVGNSSDFSRDILRVCGRCSACGHSPPSVSSVCIQLFAFGDPDVALSRFASAR